MTHSQDIVREDRHMLPRLTNEQLRGVMDSLINGGKPYALFIAKDGKAYSEEEVKQNPAIGEVRFVQLTDGQPMTQMSRDEHRDLHALFNAAREQPDDFIKKVARRLFPETGFTPDQWKSFVEAYKIGEVQKTVAEVNNPPQPVAEARQNPAPSPIGIRYDGNVASIDDIKVPSLPKLNSPSPSKTVPSNNGRA